MGSETYVVEDPVETEDWVEAITSVLETGGVQRAQFILQKLSVEVTETGAQLPYALNTPYRNTIPVAKEARMPGDRLLERGIRSLSVWSARAMVGRAKRKEAGGGGSGSGGAVGRDCGGPLRGEWWLGDAGRGSLYAEPYRHPGVS